MTECTENDHMAILRHLEHNFLTVAGEQVRYFKW
jgi:hypothetical protein